MFIEASLHSIFQARLCLCLHFFLVPLNTEYVDGMLSNMSGRVVSIILFIFERLLLGALQD